MGHLLRRCPNVTQQDRETVFFHMQTPPKLPVASQAAHEPNSTSMSVGNLPANALQPPPLAQLSPQPAMQMQAEVPFPMFEEQQSALGMLAEVSRRHMDFSSHRGQYTEGHEQGMHDDGRVLAEQALLMQFQQASGGMPQHFTTAAEGAGLYMDAVDAPPVDQKFEFSTLPETGIPSPALAGPTTQAYEGIVQSQPSAETLHQPQSQPMDPHLGTAFQPTATQYDAAVAQDGIDTEFMIWNPTNPSGRQTFGNLSAPSDEPASGFGVLQKHSKKNARGRFSDTRRKEVQEIRKRGACIRCRMLKKPCSEGTPCSTCANVESARLWKGTCIRTRLAEEFTLWSTGLFHAKARIEVPAAVQSLHQLVLPGRIEARFFANSDLCLSFAVKQYSASSKAKGKLDPSSLTNGGDDSCIWLLDEGQNMCDKIEEYANRVAQACVKDQHSRFLSATIRTAQELIQAEQDEQANVGLEPQSARSCYNLQSQLLKNTVELWVETCILTTSDTVDLQLRYDADRAPQHQPETVDWRTDEPSTVLTTLTRLSPSYNLIRSQLLAATESRCAKLAKTVINELERRLLQRQQVSRFATFISAVLLLTSVERITGFYHAFNASPSSDDNDDDTFAPAFGFTIWPLGADTSPSPPKLWPQGPHFAELLTMLLRMRALPPKTTERPDGTLAAVQDYTLPVHVQGRPVSEQIDEQVVAAAAWLDPVALRMKDLVRMTEGRLPGREDGVEGWVMRLVGALLVPEGRR